MLQTHSKLTRTERIIGHFVIEGIAFPFTETLHRQPFFSHLLPQGKLERELTWSELRLMPTPAGIWDWISATLVRMASGLA
jgi:hypothetical protein